MTHIGLGVGVGVHGGEHAHERGLGTLRPVVVVWKVGRRRCLRSGGGRRLAAGAQDLRRAGAAVPRARRRAFARAV